MNNKYAATDDDDDDADERIIMERVQHLVDTITSTYNENDNIKDFNTKIRAILDKHDPEIVGAVVVSLQNKNSLIDQKHKPLLGDYYRLRIVGKGIKIRRRRRTVRRRQPKSKNKRKSRFVRR